MCFVGVADQGLGVGLKFKSVHLKAFYIQKRYSSVQSQRTPVAIVYIICLGVLEDSCKFSENKVHPSFVLGRKENLLHSYQREWESSL